MPRLLAFSDEAAWIGAAVDAVETAVRQAVERGQERFDATLSGGTTPAPLYAALAASPAVAGLAARIALHFWVGDERDVPADSPDRNGTVIAAALAGILVGAPPQRGFAPRRGAPATLHAWPEGDRATACARYAGEISAALGAEPIFDLAILGMGADGHTAGLFTMEQVAASEAHGILALSTRAPSPPRDRMTMGATLLRRSRSAMVLLRGKAKEETLRAVLAGGSFPAAAVAGLEAVFYYLEH
jgi:6-phosphogluconolactonase